MHQHNVSQILSQKKLRWILAIVSVGQDNVQNDATSESYNNNASSSNFTIILILVLVQMMTVMLVRIPIAVTLSMPNPIHNDNQSSC